MDESSVKSDLIVDTSIVKMETLGSNFTEDYVDMNIVKIESDTDSGGPTSFVDMKFVDSVSADAKYDDANNISSSKYHGAVEASAQNAVTSKNNQPVRTYVITNIQPVVTNYHSAVSNIQPIATNAQPVRNILPATANVQPVITNVQSIASVDPNKFASYSKNRNIGTQVNFNLVSLLQNKAKRQKTKVTQTMTMKKIAKVTSTQTLLTAKPCTVGSYIQVNTASFDGSFPASDISDNTLKPLKIKLKGKTIGTQCLLGECYIKKTKETMSQTWPPLNPVNKKQTTNNVAKVLTNPVENEIMTSSTEGCKVLQKIVNESHSKNLNVKFLKNSRYEKMVSVTQSNFVGLMEEDLEIVEVQFSENGKCTINIPFRETQVKQFFVAMPGQKTVYMGKLDETLDMLTGKDYSYCPGMKANVEYADGQHYEKFTIPFPRVQSVFCQVWYKSGKRGMKVQCEHCRKATTNLYIVKQRKCKETPEQAAKRTKMDSNYPIKNLTKEQLRVRYESVNQARKSLATRLAKIQTELSRKEAIIKQFAEDSEKRKEVVPEQRVRDNSNDKEVVANDSAVVWDSRAKDSKVVEKPIIDDDIIQESIATDNSDSDFMS